MVSAFSELPDHAQPMKGWRSCGLRVCIANIYGFHHFPGWVCASICLVASAVLGKKSFWLEIIRVIAVEGLKVELLSQSVLLWWVLHGYRLLFERYP